MMNNKFKSSLLLVMAKVLVMFHLIQFDEFIIFLFFF